ncbi:MAG: TonB-dependent receptor [Breznakibacter sp.]|nr:TonB-dependent receptor [Breznakibacter sp.]
MKHVLGLLFLFLLVAKGQAQERTVSGAVTGAGDGKPIPGVSVIIKGTSQGTITDMDGNYSLKASMGDLLVFSFIGMEPATVEVTSEVINVVLKEEATDLGEVVVVGYGVQKKALVTGANANVKGDALAELNTSSAIEAMQGLAPGVNITRSNGAPGAGTKVTIRGAGTIGNAAPLYIVDGVSVGNIDYLSPSDIESIDVLKDAASAAIYGSRAANGVILVTTKKGTKGVQPLISYDGYYGIQNIYKTLPVLNAQEYMFIIDEAHSNERITPFNWEDKIVKGNNYMNTTFPGGNLGNVYGQQIWDNLQRGWKGTNWVDEMTKDNAPMQSHSFNINGATEGSTYSAGFSYFDQAGVLGGDITDAGYKRLTARLNTEFAVIKNNRGTLLAIGENFSYTNTENRAVATGNIYFNDLHNALVTNPLMPVYWSNLEINHRTGGFAPTLEGISMGQHNPIAQMFYRHNYNWSKGNNVVGNVYGVLEPLRNLKIRSSFGVEAWFGHSRSWSPTYELARQYENTVTGVQQDMYQGAKYTWTNIASYDFDINDHSFSLLAGSEMVKDVLNMNVGGSKRNTLFADPIYGYLDNTNNPIKVSEIGTWGKDWAAQGGGLMSYMGRFSYNFSEKYMATVTMRADGSSNFAEGNRWGYFPSVSAGWNFSEENFMQGFDFVDFAKLRVSWGQNGNQAIPNFVYLNNIAYKAQGYYFGPNKDVPQIGAIPANVPNPNVTWETSEQLNFGLDTRFFESRLEFNFDWYKKKTKDWLVKAPILGTFGAGAPYINGGDVENKGFEMMLSWNDNISDFKYGVSVTGAYNKNEVTRLANAEGIIYGAGSVLSQGTSDIARVQVGKPIGFFYGYKADGILQNQTEVDAYVGSNGSPIVIGIEKDKLRQPGDVRFVDQNGDGVINDDDRVMLGKPLPDFELGVQLNAEYKGVFANMTMSGKFGLQVMQSYRSFSDQLSQNYTTAIFDRWHGEGTSNRLPRLTYNSNANTQLISDIYMHDADYMRINNLTIGYKFDRLLKDVSWMSAAKVYVSVNNLYTFTKYDGMDPEVGYGPDNWSSGVDLGLYPLPRTVMFGVNLTF